MARAGRFELLEQLSQHQEAAYERLYRWVQDRCQTLEDETPAADVALQAAVRALRDRPLYYSHCQVWMRVDWAVDLSTFQCARPGCTLWFSVVLVGVFTRVTGVERSQVHV